MSAILCFQDPDYIEDNFLTQLVRDPTREGALLDCCEQTIVGDVTVGGCLGHSDCERIEFSILREARRRVSRTATMDFRRADFGLFRSLLDKVPREAVLKGKGVQEGWTIFKEKVLKAQKQAILMCQKISCQGKRPACLNREEKREKRRLYGLWKKGQATQEDYEDAVRLFLANRLTREVPVDWRLANVTPIHKKGQKEDPGNYRPVSITSVPGKVMEQIILSAIMWYVKDTQVIRPSQHGFMKGRSCLTNLIFFYDKVTHLVDEGKAVDVVYLGFSKAFHMVSHSILLEKVAARGLDESTLR
ncbi:rna-directed dna polymerase from mobile element jockey-like [Limosa lapponica baueri]|uniref:Rna-directed dna polymerase from mobile element jockey-like n=1 Tax=Limosa lapponica baueri TaxID=1758121 RepID=A0A2I0TWD1_LIMLA|nr:rna-directed dna polymerase from mobile element jockey-like [Limosa lapponica baueri]